MPSVERVEVVRGDVGQLRSSPSAGNLLTQVVDKSSALLSNYEVLVLLSELEADQLAKARSHLAAKKEEEAAQLNGTPILPVAGNPVHDEVPQNLRTVEVELIAHLKDQYPLMQQQNDVAIRNLTRALGKFSLTKSEKLQIVNLTPRQLVELYVIVENLEERFSDDDLNEMLLLVEQSFLVAPAAVTRPPRSAAANALDHTVNVQTDTTSDADAAWDAAEGDAMESYLVHETGGGVDDLEMDDVEE
ncbi:hypothetical protein FRC10_012213 [Ceratobasidium sp. 414]|nr:hypothetical protein FRC10_012213 [Ceratobasidium sp. 414]